MTIQAQQLLETFAVLKPDLHVDPIAVSPSLYPELDRDYAGFAGHVLVSKHEFTESWSTWERHPAGDEIVMLLSGRATVVLRTGTKDDTVTLDVPGRYVIVPANTWHTAQTSEPIRMLFITPGQGTENIAIEALN